MSRFLAAVTALWEAAPGDGYQSIRVAIEEHSKLLADIADTATLLAYFEVCASREDLQAQEGAVSRLAADSMEAIIAMAVVSEYVIDDILILPREMREAQLAKLAEDIGVDKESLRGFAIRWHSVYRKLLNPQDA